MGIIKLSIPKCSIYLVTFLFRFIFIKEFSFGVWNLAASKHTKNHEKEKKRIHVMT